MFTQAKVRTVSDHAREISGGALGLQAIGGDIGHGARYIDSRRQLVWLGRHGARQAASYYFGIIDGLTLADHDSLPAAVLAVREELQGNGWDGEQYMSGYWDGNSYRKRGRA